MQAGSRTAAVMFAIAILVALSPALAASAPPDLSGRWLPLPRRATPWPDPLPLTPAARERLAAFAPDRDEPAGFCMPLGTPRNTLSFTSALEVLQTDDRVYFVLQPDLTNVETRRVYLDGRPLPPAERRLPTWMGTSRGRWDGRTLVVETVDVEPQALLDGNGLSHGPDFQLRERWNVERDREFGRVLVAEFELRDPATFTGPVKLRREFAWAPTAPMPEGRCAERLWIDTLWRHRLGEHAEARREAR